MTKFRLYYDKDKACAWINEMAVQGWRVVRFGGGVYKFAPCTPGEYTYRMDFSDRFGHVSTDYRALMEDLGLSIVSVWGPWVLLEAPAGANVPPLYTDPESQEEHAKKILIFFKVMALVMIILCMIIAILCLETPMDTTTAILGWSSVGLSALMTIVFLLQCRRLQGQIDESRATRGEAPLPKRRLDPVMATGYLCLVAGLLLRDVLEPYHGVYLALCVTGLVVWCIGLYRVFARNR